MQTCLATSTACHKKASKVQQPQNQHAHPTLESNGKSNPKNKQTLQINESLVHNSPLPTSKTSSSSILVPNTIIPLVSMMGLGLRSSFWVVFFLQSRMRVMVCLCTLMATRCHLQKEAKLFHTLTGLHSAH